MILCVFPSLRKPFSFVMNTYDKPQLQRATRIWVFLKNDFSERESDSINHTLICFYQFSNDKGNILGAFTTYAVYMRALPTQQCCGQFAKCIPFSNTLNWVRSKLIIFEQYKVTRRNLQLTADGKRYEKYHQLSIFFSYLFSRN